MQHLFADVCKAGPNLTVPFPKVDSWTGSGTFSQVKGQIEILFLKGRGSRRNVEFRFGQCISGVTTATMV